MTTNPIEQLGFIPEWPAPVRVRALQTLRSGGVSPAPYDSLNLGDHVGDQPENIAANRSRLRSCLPAEPRWLQQVHGATVVDGAGLVKPVAADGIYSRQQGVVCGVMTADCLPVLFCDAAGSVVAAAHAGWRGLVAGVLENTVAAMGVPAANLMAWMGPAIGPDAFEVGDEVRAAFIAADSAAAGAFVPGRPGKWQADIYSLARLRLKACGVDQVFGGGFCTVSDRKRFFSYRRDGVTGRMASLIWLAHD